MEPVTQGWLFEKAPIWHDLGRCIFCEEEKMGRGVAVLAAAMLLAFAGHAQAQGYDSRDIMGGGPSFFGGGASPIPRTTVNYPTNYPPGTIVVNTAERRLYLIEPGGAALRYGIGVGRDGFRWSGVHRVSAKREWPGWTPPSQMRRRRPDLPGYMPGGIDNPLGARAIYLGSTLYRIHGSNEPETIGREELAAAHALRPSSPCGSVAR
jgi:lipoprotein-anchoring transpeptidase ErfK/SrfK